MIPLSELRASVARAIMGRTAPQGADAAIRIVLRAIAAHADTYVGKGRDIHDLIAELDQAASAGGESAA